MRFKKWFSILSFGDTRKYLKLLAWFMIDSIVATIPYGIVLLAIYFLLGPITNPGSPLDTGTLWKIVLILAIQSVCYLLVRMKSYIMSCCGMAEKMKKGPSEAGRKTLKCPHKQGINLNMREQKGNPRLTLLVGCLAIVILAGCVAKFGVIDQYRRLDAAQAAYASVHTEYTQMQELLKGYDRLLMEYRTYSMEWATDGSEDNGTLVDRQKALDLLEQEMLSRGRLVSLQVSGNKMIVAMSGMSLDQISRMFDVIQQSPIVSNVELNLASTEDGNVSTILDFTVRITLRSAEEADK